jgi:hypothetical protein
VVRYRHMLVRTSHRSPVHFPTATVRRLGALSDSDRFSFRASVAIAAPPSREAEHTHDAMLVRANRGPGSSNHATANPAENA